VFGVAYNFQFQIYLIPTAGCQIIPEGLLFAKDKSGYLVSQKLMAVSASNILVSFA
jgi:hypothetical protein